MIIPDKIYNILKWVAIIALPALSVFYFTISQIWGLPYGTEVSATIDALALLIGALIGVSNYNYKKGAEG